MRRLIAVLVVLLILLQARLWFGEGSLAQRHRLQQEVEQQRQENKLLDERNHLLANEVENLKQGTEAVEERARTDLGMTSEDEVFYMVVEKQKDNKPEDSEAAREGPPD